MSPPCRLLLFDEGVPSSSWNERMRASEYSVHYSSFEDTGAAPTCTVFESLAEAEVYAKERVACRPELRCRIYDYQGFVGAPIREFAGSEYKGEDGISARFRRWAGAVLFVGGMVLILADWSDDFRLTWPATIGTRMFIPCVILLATEAVFLLLARKKRGHEDEEKKI